MTKYEEMCHAAAESNANWARYRDRCWGHMALLVNGLMAYCGIPTDPKKVTFLKWNEATGEERAYREPDDGKVYTLMGATEYDAEDGYWHLGVCINLGPQNKLPLQRVFFPLCVTDDEKKLKVKLGVNGKARQIDPNDPTQLEAFYESIVETVKLAFRDPRKPSTTPIGFVVSS